MKVLSFLLVLAVGLGLTGCIDTGSEKEISETSQVAVSVNGQEVTFTEYNEYLKRVKVADNKDEKEIEKVKKEVLEGLIDQKLLLQAAKESGVDRDNDVLTAIEMAKNKLIIEGYLSKVLTGAAKPADQQLEEFYDTNKVLFGKRKIYYYDQYVIKGDDAYVESFSSKLQQLERSNQLSDFLAENNVEFQQQAEIRSSEKLPPKLALAMTRLSEGDIGFFKVSDGLVIIGLNKAKDAPIDFESAKKFITPVLEKEMREKFVKNMIDGIRSTAEIKYNPILKQVEEINE